MVNHATPQPLSGPGIGVLRKRSHTMSDLKGHSFVSMLDLSAKQIEKVLKTAA